jgi:hypothetical protein
MISGLRTVGNFNNCLLTSLAPKMDQNKIHLIVQSGGIKTILGYTCALSHGRKLSLPA